MKTPYWDNISLNANYNFVETDDVRYLVLKILQDCDSVFECSVGTGIIPKLLRAKNFNGEYLGSDYSDAFLKFAGQNNPTETFVEMDLSQPFGLNDKSFDCVVIRHGLEYVYPYKPALEEFKRIARKYIFIIFWVDFMPANQIRFNDEGKWNVNYYSKDEFYNTLKELQLEVVEDKTILSAKQGGKYNHFLMLKV